MSLPTFLLDANTMIQAHRHYYSFDIAPGFWDALLHEHGKNRVYSLDMVKREIYHASQKPEADNESLPQSDMLEQWVRDKVPESFFLERDAETIAKFTNVMQWVQRQSRFTEASRAKFAQGADGWLIAYAAAHDMVLITFEKPAPTGEKIKIPDVCQPFGVSYINTFEMLRQLQVQFILR